MHYTTCQNWSHGLSIMFQTYEQTIFQVVEFFGMEIITPCISNYSEHIISHEHTPIYHTIITILKNCSGEVHPNTWLAQMLSLLTSVMLN